MSAVLSIKVHIVKTSDSELCFFLPCGLLYNGLRYGA